MYDPKPYTFAFLAPFTRPRRLLSGEREDNIFGREVGNNKGSSEDIKEYGRNWKVNISMKFVNRLGLTPICKANEVWVSEIARLEFMSAVYRRFRNRDWIKEKMDTVNDKDLTNSSALIHFEPSRKFSCIQ